ncbi:MAG: hypothetical protein M0R80_13515 [Proteobacteria bacterium]|nr:hypothetical protein [Pseudomonadota bacterium]
MAKTYTDQAYSGTLATAGATAATIAASTTFVMQGFCISNANASARKAELLVDDKRILPYLMTIPAGDVLIRTGLNMPVTTGLTIKVKGEVNSDMDYYIWGINEVTS